MVDVTPGLVQSGGRDSDGAVAVVTKHLEKARSYLTDAAPVGRYVVVRVADDLPDGLELGGLALLDGEPLEPGLVAKLSAALGLGSVPDAL